MISAQAWADHLAATNSFDHSPDSDLNGVCLGENLYTATGDESSAIDATPAWYCEVDDYKKNPNVWNPATGHFTQVNENFIPPTKGSTTNLLQMRNWMRS